MIDRDGKQTSSCMDSSIIPHEKKNCVLIDICSLKHLSQKKWVQDDVEFCRSEKVFSSLVRIMCLSTLTIRPTLSSRAETTALNIFLTISVWLYFYSSDGDDRIKEFMYEFHNSIIHHIIYTYLAGSETSG